MKGRSRGLVAVILAAALPPGCGGRSLSGDDANLSTGDAPPSSGVGGIPSPSGGSALLGGRPGGGGTPGVGGAPLGGVSGASAAGEMSELAGAPPSTSAGGEGLGAGGEAIAGAGGEPSGSTCDVDGEVHHPGERWGRGCQICTCAANGTWSCDSSLCNAVCINIAKRFALLRSQTSRCDVADTSACTLFVGPRSLRCGCPVPYSTDQAAEAEQLRARYADLECATTPDPPCDCAEWDTAYCNEGRCNIVE